MDFSNHTVLIVDDNETFRYFLKSMIEKHLKAVVVERDNPEAAFEYLEENRPSLIILDMEMPVMDGFTALKRLRSEYETKDIPVIACSALGSKDLVVSLAKLKIETYIVKNTDPKTTLKKIAFSLKKIDEKESTE